MFAKRIGIGVLAVVMGAILARSASGVLIGSCCICKGCPAAEVVCVAPAPPDTLPDTLSDGGICGISCPAGCQSDTLVDGFCLEHASECTPPAPAPATSLPVLLGLAGLLGSFGFYLVRRRAR